MLGDGGLIVIGKVPGLARVGEWVGPHALALLQSVEPLGRVGDETWLAHFAVADDIETGRDLLFHAICHRLANALRECGIVDRLAILARQHQFKQIVGARQAADMRGQYAVGTEFHLGPVVGIYVVVRQCARRLSARSMNVLS